MTTCVAMDVAYGESDGVATAVVFDGWTADRIVAERVAHIDTLKPYVPGRFYQRELPCLLTLLEMLDMQPDVAIVDGYVWLDRGRAGLGAKLHDALGGAIAVVGVAKAPFVRDGHKPDAHEVKRGRSQRPLYVTAAGMDPAVAAAHVASMHGAHRMPHMLSRVDALGRAFRQSSTTRLRPDSLAR